MLDPEYSSHPAELHPSRTASCGHGERPQGDVNLFVEGHRTTGDRVKTGKSQPARSHVEALEERGVDGSKMQARGLGEFQPADSSTKLVVEPSCQLIVQSTTPAVTKWFNNGSVDREVAMAENDANAGGDEFR